MTTPSKPEASLRELLAKWRAEASELEQGDYYDRNYALYVQTCANELEAALSARDEAVYEGSGCVFCDLNTEHKGNPCTATPPAASVDEAFAEAMKGRIYGDRETANARAWFVDGWSARLASVAPAGMVLVPREPTDPMIEAATETAFTLDPDESTHGWATAIYAAMLAAAPTPPATAGEE